MYESAKVLSIEKKGIWIYISVRNPRTVTPEQERGRANG